MGDVWKAPKWLCEATGGAGGLRESKGKIAPGFDADIVIVDRGRAPSSGRR